VSSVALIVVLEPQGVSHELHHLLRSLSYGTGISAIAVRPYAHKYAP